MLFRRRFILLSSGVVLGALPLVPLIAQEAEVGPQPGRDSAIAPDSGVYVGDSAIVSERIALAERMERSKEWGKAADLLQEVIEKHGHRIVPADHLGAAPGGGAEGAVKRYIGAPDLVQRRLAQWPADGLAAYNARYGHVAQSLLDAAPFDPATLGRVERDYFVTQAGQTAAVRRIDLALAAGEFGSAAWMTDRLLGVHPTLGDDRPAVLFRAGVAHHFAGDVPRAAAALDELRARHADAVATLAGERVALVDALAKIVAEPPDAGAVITSETWTMLGGDASRGRLPAVVGRPGARVAHVDFVRAAPRRPGARYRDAQSDYQRRLAESQGASVMPVADRGELFFNDGQRVYGVSLDSGFPLPGWATTYPGAARSAYVLPGSQPAGVLRTRQWNTTVTGDAVLAILAQGERRWDEQVGIATLETKLVCLDRRTGAQRWIADTGAIADESLRTMTLSGSPLVVGDNVYVTGRSAKQPNFEDCYVVCFGLSDGRPRWTGYVSGASVYNPGWGGMVTANDNEAHVAYSGGRLFVSTNLGAVAALDAYGGGLIWLTTYPRGGAGADAANGRGGPLFNPRMQMQMGPDGTFQQPGGASTPWGHNPPIVRDGHVFTLPTDSRDVVIFDAGSGAVRQTIERRHIGHLDTLVGVTDTSVVLAGDTGDARGRGNGAVRGDADAGDAAVLGIDWRNYDPKRFKVTRHPAPPDPAVTFKRELAGGGPLAGRPFLSSTDVSVPAERRLFRVEMSTNKLQTDGTYPAWPASWEKGDPDGEGPGNVLVTGDHVVLAGPRRVDVYTDRALARRKLDAREAAAPADPLPRLIYAEVMFVAGDVATALAKLDAAIELMGGRAALLAAGPSPLRERLFTDALTFADKLAAMPATATGVHAQAAAFYDRAALAAATPEQQVGWRLARARLYESNRDYDNAVRTYQEILASAAMRAVPGVDERTGPVSSAALAERRIDGAITAAGGSRQCYAPFERLADDRYNTARAAGDAAALMDVAASFPNAAAAPRALVAASERHEAAGDHRLAVHVLRQAMRKRALPTDARTAVIEAIARNYLALPGGTDSAIARLSKAQRPMVDPPLTRPMKLVDGTVLSGRTFMSVLAELRRRGEEPTAAVALPDLRLASKEFTVDPATGRKRFKPAFRAPVATEAIDNVRALLVPPVDLARHDRLVTWNGRALVIYAVGSKQPVATFTEVSGLPLGAAWLPGGDLIAWTDFAVYRLSPDGGGGAVRWSAPLNNLPALGAMPEGAGPEFDPTLAEGIDVEPPRFAGNRPFGMPRGGMGMPQVPPPPPVPSGGREQVIDLRPTDARVVLLTSGGRVAGLDLADGRLSWQVRLSDRGPQRLVATDEFTVARSTAESSSALLVLDTFSGDVLARPRFTATTGAPLANFALSRQGMLVYTLADRLATKDLFEPWEGNPPNERMAEGGPGNAVFGGAVGPDQLVVNDGLAAALSGGGMVRVYSLLTQRQHTQQLATGAGEWEVSLRMIGTQLYSISPRAYRSFDLVNPAPPEAQLQSLGDMERSPTVRGALFGQRHVVLLDTMGQPEGIEALSTSYRLWAFSRERVNGIESGIIDDIYVVPPDKAGITDWQAVDGGLYYRTADAKLHFLRGARGEGK